MQIKVFIFTVSFIFISAFSFAAQTDTLKVSGNCSTCKKHIESAAKAAGVSTASWNLKTQDLIITYDADKISRLAIEHKIADAGYDTQDIKATDVAYDHLEKCCRYTRQ